MGLFTYTVPGLLELGYNCFTGINLSGGAYTVDLMASATVTGDGSQPSDYQVAGFYGYSQLTVNQSELLPSVIPDEAVITIEYANNPLGWTNSGTVGVTIYGYWITSTGTGTVIGWQVFTNPHSLEAQTRMFLDIVLNVFAAELPP
jgi:hypothetical protein